MIDGHSGFLPVDTCFADFILRIADTDCPLLWFSAALTSRAVGEGHICLDMTRAADHTIDEIMTELHHRQLPNASAYRLPPLHEWMSSLLEAKLQTVVSAETRSARCPLIVDTSGRLYLQRYHDYEVRLVERIRKQAVADWAHDLQSLDMATELLPMLFPEHHGDFSWQRLAGFLALRRNLTVISGGPGTGKTTTVARILALLVQRTRTRSEPPPRIKLAAPTGKAAARMSQSIEDAKTGSSSGDLLDDPFIQGHIPDTATTIHRLLGYRRNSPYFMHDHSNPLNADVVVIDEASMVALPLMAKLFDAMRPQAKLILIGDMNQLASVEPGHVLGDICAAAGLEDFSIDCSQEYESMGNPPIPGSLNGTNPLGDCFVGLRRSHRFPAGGAIDIVSRAIKDPLTPEHARVSLNTIKDTSRSEEPRVFTWWGHHSASHLPDAALAELHAGFSALRSADSPAEALARLNEFRVLAALRHGPYGVKRLNRLIENILQVHEGTTLQSTAHYHHRPVLITRNDYSLELFNGDVGIVMPDEHGRLRAWFMDGRGGVRSVAPHVLPPHETCYAMTVHKSQGSEFERVLVILPDRDNPIVTKELVYTAITRSKAWVGLVASEETLKAAILRSSRSFSGLKDRLTQRYAVRDSAVERPTHWEARPHSPPASEGQRRDGSRPRRCRHKDLRPDHPG